ncbi:MAG: hypothetical protein IJK73_05795 [Bacteroidales bacterium]|nr:hypothetical protein [Bacteroidales bacterium]
MKTEKNILENIGKASFTVPEGYFDDLRGRLGSIATPKVTAPGFFYRAKPYLALAACFVAILIAGTTILRNTVANDPTDLTFSEASYAQMAPFAIPEDYYQEIGYDLPTEELSDEDIIEYLIESGTQVELLAYAGNQ